ncbi:MAG: AAA family ATPase, partial [Peptostreptococcales bacterium]
MIKHLRIKQFAGIEDLEIDMKEGLNVILGPNEAGKSTLVDALYALLFVDAKLNLKKVSSKQFMERALPYQKSDYAEGSLHFSFDGDDYILSKLWHHQKNELHMTKNGMKILDKSVIEDVLRRYLVYGEGTYAHVVFSKQDAFKRVFEAIKEDRESINNIEALLKKASMALDGLSIEAYRSRLSDILKDLTGNWDFERNRPVGNRMSDDPHKRNVGEILSHFYKIDSAKKDLEKACDLEENLANYKKEMILSEKSIDNILKNSDLDEGTESELIQGGMAKKELEMLENEYKALIEINRE